MQSEIECKIFCILKLNILKLTGIVTKPISCSERHVLFIMKKKLNLDELVDDSYYKSNINNVCKLLLMD